MIENTWNAALYDAHHNFVTVAGQALIDLLDPQSGERILDLGCGTGHHVRQLTDLGAHAVGIDGADDMIAAARQSYPDLDFRVADGAEFTVEAPFDAVFSNAALHWMQRPEMVIARVAAAPQRGARPGSRTPWPAPTCRRDRRRSCRTASP